MSTACRKRSQTRRDVTAVIVRDVIDMRRAAGPTFISRPRCRRPTRQGGSHGSWYETRTTATRQLSAEATGWVWRHSPFHASSLLVHLAIADVVNDANGNELWMTVEALAAKARVGRSSTVTALTALVDQGFLEVTERGGGRGRPTRYTFIMRPPESAKETVRSSAGSPAKPANKPRDMDVETVQSGAPIGITQVTQHNANDDSISAIVDGRDADPSCVSCRGLGRVYNASGGFDAPCHCTWDPEYVSAPSTATRPPVGFGMPANRGGDHDREAQR